METKQKLKLGDEIVCITDDIDAFTKDKIYYIKGVYTSTFNTIDDDGYERVFLIINIGEYFKLKEEKESVNHPSHYGGENNPLEVINIIEHYDLNFNLGNVIKYCLRAGKKDELIQELKKAQWYINREIQRLEK